MKKQRLFFSGTSNIVLPVRNKTLFPAAYQDKTRLTYYASLFNSVEVNSSFYKMPLSRTIRKWADEVPDGFGFTFKLFNDVTHATKQVFNLQHMPEFLSRISTTEKKGCLLDQLPPKFGVDLFQLGSLLAELPVTGHLAVEFRNPTWYTDDVFQLLNDHQAAMVIHDMPWSRTPLELTSDKVYIFVFMARKAVIGEVTATIFWLTMPGISMNGLTKAEMFIPISTTQWAMLFKI
jgi:uncharacterized protein YecE (DUF72 family)